MISRFLIWLKIKLIYRFIPDSFSYDLLTGVFTIYGMKYSEGVFKSWAALGIPLGMKFTLESREDKCVYLRRCSDDEYLVHVPTPSEKYFPGWYYVDEAQQLHGPFVTKPEALNMLNNYIKLKRL